MEGLCAALDDCENPKRRSQDVITQEIIVDSPIDLLIERLTRVDHVVISKRGIFVIETKNWSKPDKVWEMEFDGEKIHIPTQKADAAPIVQCRAQVSDIRTLLKESTSNDFPVRGVVVFLDCYVKRTPSARGADIWVLNPKELAGWMRRESVVLDDSDVSVAVLHLKQYVKKLAT